MIVRTHIHLKSLYVYVYIKYIDDVLLLLLMLLLCRYKVLVCVCVHVWQYAHYSSQISRRKKRVYVYLRMNAYTSTHLYIHILHMVGSRMCVLVCARRFACMWHSWCMAVCLCDVRSVVLRVYVHNFSGPFLRRYSCLIVHLYASMQLCWCTAAVPALTR